MDFYIPEFINTILNALENAGYQAYVVGGCVRDMILGKTPHDYDITTSANPDEIQRTFKDYKTLLVGKQFGTVVVVQKSPLLDLRGNIWMADDQVKFSFRMMFMMI
jgi:tRNA nucleotidyltransferase (CCA-adding enzyme)